MVSTLLRRGSHSVASSVRTLPRPLLYGGVGLLGAVLLALALLVGLRLARPGVLPGVELAGAPLAGLEGEELDAAIVDAGRAEVVVTVHHGDAEVSATGREIGYALDLEATREAVWRRGRQGNPVAALVDHLRAFGSSPIAVDLVDDVDETALDAFAQRVTEELDSPAVEGSLRFEGTTVERVDPRPGIAIVTDDIPPLVRAALLDGGDTRIEAPGEPIEPETTAAAVDRLETQAQRALSGPVVLERGEGALRVEPATMAELLEVERDGSVLRLAVDADALAALVDDDLRAALATEPQDASIELDGDEVRIVEAVEGFAFDREIAADQLLEVATGTGAREATLDGEITEPELTTADAEALEIVEPVSSFTTHFQCCQSRVTNIQRIADIVDGVLIEPGETFSVNEFVGPRTVEKGFVGGGAIFEGEFVEQIGGGVSQFATTMYNAAFFGGYEIPDYKAHSYYISRYPVGREATLNYPNVDLKVRNNSPYGLLVDTSYTSTSVTVTFWGKTWVEVSDITGQPTNVRPPPEQIRENPALAPGTSRLVQSGRNGFDITVVRVLRFPDGREERENIFTRYLPEPRIIERNSAQPDPPPEDPDPVEDETPPDDGDPDDGDPDDGDPDPGGDGNGS